MPMTSHSIRAALAPHLAYLRYVLRHKWFVFRAGVRLGVPLWRLVVHDLSKFSPAEWGAYVRNFYGAAAQDVVLTQMGRTEIDERDPDYVEFRMRLAHEQAARRVEFDRAWLHHQHANPHHWQHWMLREDSGATKVLVMPAVYVREMVADWIGAGTKILDPDITLEACVIETARWYLKNMHTMQLRDITRSYAESLLIDAATWGANRSEVTDLAAVGAAAE